jgi:membrane protein implicated in regulation of membrane protease activity
MKIPGNIGSLAFVPGLFCAVFGGIPWHVIVADDPALPGWLKIALFSLLGGILVVLGTVAVEQRKTKTQEKWMLKLVVNLNCLI